MSSKMTKVTIAILCVYFGYSRIIRWLKTNILHLPALNSECRNTTSPLRDGAKLIKLSRGYVCYKYDRPPQNFTTQCQRPLVVLVHGFIGSHAYFESLATQLATKYGRTVLRYDMYGRGHSNWDGTPQTLGLFTGQLAELLLALNEIEPIDLVGYSMGGGIVGEFAQLHPRCIRSLSLLSPITGNGDNCRYHAGLGGVGIRVFSFLLRQIPPFCAKIMHRLVQRLLVHQLDSQMWNNPKKNSVVEFERWMEIRNTHEPALGASILNTLTHFPLWKGAEAWYGGLAAHQFPIFLGWGARDEGPATHQGYAKEAFVAMGGVSHRPNEDERLETLSRGNGSGEESSEDDDDEVFNAHGREFAWFNGSHCFAIEDGEVVAERLNCFWSCKKARKCTWRKAESKDAERMNLMIEKAYKLGDEFFVDYDVLDPGTGGKYTRTSYEAVLNAVSSSSGNDNDQSNSTTFMVGEMRMNSGEQDAQRTSDICACVQIHPCKVPNQAEISFLTVSNDAQGKGVAKEAMNIAETIAINSGYLSIGIDVVSTKPWLSEFYVKQGYRMTGESSKWPVPQFLKQDYRTMFFHRQTKSIVERDLTIHVGDLSGSLSPRTSKMYNDL